MKEIGQGNDWCLKEWPKMQKEVQTIHCWSPNKKDGRLTTVHTTTVHSTTVHTSIKAGRRTLVEKAMRQTRKVGLMNIAQNDSVKRKDWMLERRTKVILGEYTKSKRQTQMSSPIEVTHKAYNKKMWGEGRLAICRTSLATKTYVTDETRIVFLGQILGKYK